MTYIPKAWCINTNNMNAVYEIVGELYSSDICLVDPAIMLNEAAKKLRGIGETVIAEKLENGEITG